MSADPPALRLLNPRWLMPLLVSLLFAGAAAAHQQKESITRVLFNERTGNIEVMHRLLIHDAEHASRRLFGDSADLLGKPADCDRFEAYVHSKFFLKDQHGEAIDLQPVGNEIEGKFLWVYAEAPIPEGLTALTLSHHALRDVWPEQSNLVNVDRDGLIKSAVFGRGSEEISLSLSQDGTPQR